jgi:hypothetical protein
MSYEMHRIFCATPFELEEERLAFHAAVSRFNESEAMPRNLLFIPVTLPPNLADKRAYHNVLLENIRDARYFVQLLEDSWGPPERNFERDYAMARQYVEIGSHKLRETVLLFKKPLLPHRVEQEIVQLKQQSQEKGSLVEFASLEELEGILKGLMARWMEGLPLAQSAEAGHSR